MSGNPVDSEWQTFITLIKAACKADIMEEFCQLFFTLDEREALTMRLKIIEALMRNQQSQREIKERLKVGIATITRGSTSLRSAPPELVQWLHATLKPEENNE